MNYKHYRKMLKDEESQPLEKSKNVREQRKKVFGVDANAPRMSEKRQKMMNQIKRYAEDTYKMPLKIAQGKRDDSGDLRTDKDNQEPFDVFTNEGHEKEKQYLSQLKDKGVKRVDPKPSWTPEGLETQPSPDAAIHELAHAALAPEGMNPKQHQEHMDELWGQSQSKYGHLKQKRTAGEIQPMAVENSIRRQNGLPANKATKPVTQNENALDYDGKRFVEGKDSKGKKAFYDRQTRLQTPETRDRLEQIKQGTLKFHPEKGWLPSDSSDALINLRGQGRQEEAQNRAKKKFGVSEAPKKMAASEMEKARADDGLSIKSKRSQRAARGNDKAFGGRPEWSFGDPKLDRVSGINKPTGNKIGSGTSKIDTASGNKSKSNRVLNEIRAMPKPNLTKAKVDQGKSVDQKRTDRNQRAESWEKENRGMHSGSSSNPTVSKFLHNAKLHQIKTNPTPKLTKMAKNEVIVSYFSDGTVEVVSGSLAKAEILEKIESEIQRLGYMEKKEYQLKAKDKSKKGGLTESGRKAYNRATGSNLKAPQPGGGPRKKSYCARSAGQMKMHNISCSKTPDKRVCLARRRWKC